MIDEGLEVRGNGSFADERRDAPESTAAVKQEIAATRERMSGTIAELEQRVSGTVDGVKQKVGDVKQKVDVIELARRHPWPALAAAFVAGVALSATGADRRAARATTRAAKRAPEATKRGATEAVRATVSGVSQLASAAADRIKGSPDADTAASAESGGLAAKTAGVLRAQVREFGDEVQRGADELSSLAPPPRSSGI